MRLIATTNSYESLLICITIFPVFELRHEFRSSHADEECGNNAFIASGKR